MDRALAASPTDRIVCLEIGADDYLAKLFEPRELLARLRALLRRELESAPVEVLRFADWIFDIARRRLTASGGAMVTLTPGENKLLRMLPTDLAVSSIANSSWSKDGDAAEPFDRAVDLAISRLRRKLAEHDAVVLIETARGEGYRFVPKARRG